MHDSPPYRLDAHHTVVQAAPSGCCPTMAVPVVQAVLGAQAVPVVQAAKTYCCPTMAAQAVSMYYCRTRWYLQQPHRHSLRGHKTRLRNGLSPRTRRCHCIHAVLPRSRKLGDSSCHRWRQAKSVLYRRCRSMNYGGMRFDLHCPCLNNCPYHYSTYSRHSRSPAAPVVPVVPAVLMYYCPTRWYLQRPHKHSLRGHKTRLRNGLSPRTPRCHCIHAVLPRSRKLGDSSCHRWRQAKSVLYRRCRSMNYGGMRFDLHCPCLNNCPYHYSTYSRHSLWWVSVWSYRHSPT